MRQVVELVKRGRWRTTRAHLNCGQIDVILTGSAALIEYGAPCAALLVENGFVAQTGSNNPPAGYFINYVVFHRFAPSTVIPIDAEDAVLSVTYQRPLARRVYSLAPVTFSSMTAPAMVSPTYGDHPESQINTS